MNVFVEQIEKIIKEHNLKGTAEIYKKLDELGIPKSLPKVFITDCIEVAIDSIYKKSVVDNQLSERHYFENSLGDSSWRDMYEKMKNKAL